MKYLLVVVVSFCFAEAFECDSTAWADIKYTEVYAEVSNDDDPYVYEYKIVISVDRADYVWLQDLFPPCQQAVMVYGEGSGDSVPDARHMAWVHAMLNLSCLNVPYYDQFLVLERYWDRPQYHMNNPKHYNIKENK